jgi:replicative DNA helicase
MEKKNPESLEKVFTAVGKMVYEWECNIYDSFQDYDTLVQLIHKEAMLWSQYVFIDYLQKIKNKWKYNNMHHNISEMSMGLKHLAQKLGIQIVMLAQLNRESAKWVPRKPILSDLKESWSIEEDSVAVILLHDESMSDPYSDQKWMLDIIVAKNRHWPIWDFKVRVNKPTFTITDI